MYVFLSQILVFKIYKTTENVYKIGGAPTLSNTTYTQDTAKVVRKFFI